jgi:hypothetical protein
MKIVQSYWSKPGIENTNWAEKKLHYFSWVLSCLKLKQYYNKVELVTDRAGKELLIDQLQLPYDSVQVELDFLNEYDPLLWALGKIYAYSIQDEPFIHVDGDIFIWGRFSDEIESADLIAQHEEDSYEFSNTYYDGLLNADLDSYPKAILQFRNSVTTNIMQANAGILGGNDINFIQRYCKEAFKFVDENKEKALKVKHPGMFNTIFEQYLFYCMANTENKPIKYLFEEEIDCNFEKIVPFEDIPYNARFIHILGSHKRNIFFNQKIMQYLWYEFPQYYNRVNHFVQ